MYIQHKFPIQYVIFLGILYFKVKIEKYRADNGGHECD